MTVVYQIGDACLALFAFWGLWITWELCCYFFFDEFVARFYRRKGRAFSRSLRQQCVVGLHKRSWDAIDEWEIHEDLYDSDEARQLRKLGNLTGMAWCWQEHQWFKRKEK